MKMQNSMIRRGKYQFVNDIVVIYCVIIMFYEGINKYNVRVLVLFFFFNSNQYNDGQAYIIM